MDNVKPCRDKIKSQRGGSVDVFVTNRVKWPHEYVLSGQTKDRITYNQLSSIQWMTGFCRTIREESDLKIIKSLCLIMLSIFSTMLQTSPGLLQRPAMQFYCVVWNRVKYKAGH